MIALLALMLITACEAPSTDPNTAQDQAATVTPIPTAPAVARPTYTVERGTVQESLEFTGRWQPRDQLELSFEIAGTIRQVTVQRGDQISAGQLLADFQITELEDQLEQARLSLETAQSNLTSGTDSSVQSVADAEVNLANARLNLESTRAGSPWTQVESARISLDNAQDQLEKARLDYDDALSRPGEPAASVDAALAALRSAENGVRSAQSSYNSAAQSFNNHEYSVSQAYNNVIAAELALERARSGAGDPTGEQAVRSEQLTIDQINEDIARSSLISPIDATVLEVTISPGTQVAAFDTVMTIGIPEPLEAIANLPIGDAQRLAVGLVGICNVINQPDSAVQCVVRQIPLSAQDADQTTRVAASLEGVPSGQLIEVEMPLEVREDVLWLPPAAIRTFQNRTFVVLQTADGPRSADVQLGLQTDDRIEIVAGVNEGDIVEGP
jgi:multidrug efflux pump subunit AcrA (membrane-fusion protein)